MSGAWAAPSDVDMRANAPAFVVGHLNRGCSKFERKTMGVRSKGFVGVRGNRFARITQQGARVELLGEEAMR